MPNITLSISEELKKEMEKYSSVRWSSAVRNVIEKKIADFEDAEKIAKKTKLNWKDWKLIGAKISKNAAKHAEALLNEGNS
ncbi:MAG: hypothetical protein KGH61_01060 [Candidatus Micrarchaeota archaeon]|nr:hypothetical protein [Candidatus Micrarchaeota archaeon]MDE1847523.1 hypothetical protein [Candidatus Micrarchaeota archaeon]MDE1863841.1 hypothetical protein [Candidatus Micrarchaeota archaeon]